MKKFRCTNPDCPYACTVEGKDIPTGCFYMYDKDGKLSGYVPQWEGAKKGRPKAAQKDE